MILLAKHLLTYHGYQSMSCIDFAFVTSQQISKSKLKMCSCEKYEKYRTLPTIMSKTNLYQLLFIYLYLITLCLTNTIYIAKKKHFLH